MKHTVQNPRCIPKHHQSYTYHVLYSYRLWFARRIFIAIPYSIPFVLYVCTGINLMFARMKSCELILHIQEFGVKGPSWLSTIPQFDIIKGMSFDYMHCVLLVVCRLLLRLWFNSSFHQEIWYIGTAVKSVDNRLCSICPPNEIQRTPRSIETTVKYWKGANNYWFIIPTPWLYLNIHKQLMSSVRGYCTTAQLYCGKYFMKIIINITSCCLKQSIYY